MFVDETEVFVQGGRGGNGIVAFLREKFRPKGGPSGGDGGRGGKVIFEVSREATTLLELYRRRKLIACNGEPGGQKNRAGKGAPDLVVRVPLGTVVKDAETEVVLFDLTDEGQKCVVAAGGKGGLGNQHFATPTNQTPRKALPGKPGESRLLKVELKLIADAGLVGFPNAGKSTLLSMVSAARPKIASYPFTTKEPMLGIVSSGDYREFVMADLPGLIEGASDGAGLGHEFLRHIERTRLIVHMIDAAPIDGTDPVENVERIRREISSYSAELGTRPEILVANKMDLPEAEENLARLRAAYGENVLPLSAATGSGLKPLIAALFQALMA